MSLINTSVLIEYFKGIDNEGTEKFQFIQDQNIEFGITNLIYLELLQGSKDINEYNYLKDCLETQIFYNLKNEKLPKMVKLKVYLLILKVMKNEKFYNIYEINYSE